MTALLAAPSPRYPDGATYPDFLAVLRRSGVLTGRQFEKVRARVRRGRYPADPVGLARKLVKKGGLTEYQARRLLHGDRPSLVFGRYVILDRLGRGSMGRVYKARHRMMGRVVALKVADPEAVSPRGSIARFRREMLPIGRLDNPNIARAFDADQVGPVPFLVMELVTGQDLDRLFRARGPLPPAEAIGYAAQAALGLAHAHARGVVHRDIKPANLMVDDEGRLKILDFGIAKTMGPCGQDPEAKRSGDGLAVGTVEYMSPEQACGPPVDGRSDLYSLGCVLYHLLTGHLPFPAESKLECLALRAVGRPVPISELRPDLPPCLTESWIA